MGDMLRPVRLGMPETKLDVVLLGLDGQNDEVGGLARDLGRSATTAAMICP